MPASTSDVFINCPFDDAYTVAFQCIVFSIRACGFRVRCALEVDDAAETRIDKLYRIIEQSRYAVHDLSRTTLDPGSNLPRFNMPLELGIFLGAKRFGDDRQKAKRCAILDIEQYRYQMFISDISGMDIKAHGDDPRRIVGHIRDFLYSTSRRTSIPTIVDLLDQYDRFLTDLPAIAITAGLDPDRILFPDFERLVNSWIKADRA